MDNSKNFIYLNLAQFFSQRLWSLLKQPEDDHTAQHHDAAHQLSGGQAFAEQQEGDDCGKYRLGGENQVGNARGQQAETDVVQPEACHGGHRRQQKQHNPTVECAAQPQKVR